MNNDQQLLDRVRKLLAHAEGAGTQAEADAFNAKAADLIARYGIQEALLAASGDKTDTIDQRHITTPDPYSADKAHLVAAVAEPLRCRSIRHTRPGGRVRACTVFGYTTDLERVELLYTSLLLQATTQLVRARPPSWTGESVAAYRRSWLYGFACAVYQRLEAAEKRAEQEATDAGQHADGTSTALVLLGRTTRVERALTDAFPDMIPGRRRTLTGSGSHHGYTAGQRADIGTRPLGPRRRQLDR